MAGSARRLPLGFLAAGLLLPGLLAGAWGVLTFGGSIERLAQDELRTASGRLAALRDDLISALGQRAEREGFALSLDADGRPSTPFRAVRTTLPEEAELPTAVATALDLEARGRAAEALRFLEFQRDRNPATLGLEGFLALARCLHASHRSAEARTLLADLRERPPTDHRTLIPPRVTIDLLQARIAAETGDTAPARALRRRLLTAHAAVPAGSLASLLDSTNTLIGTVDSGEERLVRAAARAALTLQFGLLAAPEEAGRTADGHLLLRGAPRQLRLLLSDAADEALEKALGARPDDEVLLSSATPAEGTLASLDLAPYGPRVHARWRGKRPSTRLQQAARALLILAAAAFLGGNLWLLRLVRREATVSRMKSGFIDLVSHELRTPLAALSMKAELLAHGHVPEMRLASYHRDLYAEARKLGDLVNGILDFARLEKGSQALERETLDVRRVIARAVRDGRTALRLAGQHLGLRVPRVLPAVTGDGEVLSRALRNLLENAARYAPRGSGVELSATPSGPGRLVISVADRGPGVPQELRTTIFEPFRRGRGSRNVQVNGTGLGLAMVSQAARAHGGSASVRERPGGGAEFALELPTG